MGVLVNKPNSVTKGTSQTIEFNQSNILALVSDAYFEDVLNWSKITLYYRDATGNQKSYVSLDVGGTNGIFKTSNKARVNTWQLYKILIEDFDGGTYVIKRATLGSSDDIVVSA
jgi:hypothetical protein